MTVPTFELRRNKHAISEFGATISFFKPVGQATFARCFEVINRVAEEFDLPAPMNMQVFTFNLQSPQSAPETSTGYGRQRFSKNGEPEFSVFYDSDSVQVTLRDYSTWAEVLPKIMACMLPIVEVFRQEVPAIKAVGIRYTNEFRGGKNATAATVEVINPVSEWAPPIAKDTTDAWHSHVGRFEPISRACRRLVNVNMASALALMPDSTEPRHLVTVQIQVNMNYDIPGEQPLILDSEELATTVERVFNSAHDREKAVLAEVINPQYLRIMGA